MALLASVRCAAVVALSSFFLPALFAQSPRASAENGAGDSGPTPRPSTADASAGRRSPVQDPAGGGDADDGESGDDESRPQDDASGVDPVAEDRVPRGRKVVVTALREPVSSFEVPYSVAAITSADIRRRSYRTTPQALREIPGIMVQETAHGHGSPYIRGFTSFRNLFLIDGVRLNNSVFRSGPNQYWNTVDALSLDRIEVVKGPSSVLYGSDAIGGTVAAYTASSSFGPGETGRVRVGGNSYVRYSTAEDSVQGRIALEAAQTWNDDSWSRLLVGVTGKAFGDLEGGADVGTQPETGYTENDIDLKFEHFFDEDLKFTFLLQRVVQDDVPRTHRTVDAIMWRGLSQGSDLRREFDQRRTFMYWDLEASDLDSPLFDTVRTNLSFHQQNETRDRVRGNGNREIQGFKVDTFGAFMQFGKSWDLGRTTYGFEYYHDAVQSFLTDLSDPFNAADSIQGPVADDASYDLVGVYLQHMFPLGDHARLTLGGRFQFAAADANEVRDPMTDTQISVDDSWSAFVGSARLLVPIVPDQLNFFGGVSQGFRAPNLSDLTRFDTARTNEFEIPSPGLNAERYITYEAGLKAENDLLSVQTSYFYTDIQDQIQRFPTGNTNMAGDFEVTRSNVGDGHIYGVEFGGAWRVFDDTEVYANATFLEGRVETFDQAGSPITETYLTRLMPFTGQLGVRWESPDRRFWLDGFVMYADDADRLSLRDRRDTSRIPPGGTPDYTTLNLRSAWAINDDVDLHVLLENITDVDYRVHGSGLNRPGRNLILGMQARF